MLRIYLGMFHLLGVMLLKFFFGGDVTTTLDVPAQINAGKEIKVQITINKGDLQGFSRFQMELPAGLTASNVSSANADFSFKDQKVRFIWLRLPEEPTITIAFNILCFGRLKGDFELQGKFSYIDDNEQKDINIQPQAVAIVPSPSIAPDLLVDIRDFGKIALPQPGSSEGQVACIRQKPVWSDVNKDYEVTLLINKESLQKFAKIEEIIPTGYTAVNIDSKEGVFTFKDNKIKFLWMNLGVAPYFTVSYKLIPSKNTAASQSPSIAGTFSYMIADKTKSIPIIEKNTSLANLTPEMVKSLIQEPVYLASNNPSAKTPSMQEQLTSRNARNIPVDKVEKTPAKNISGPSNAETMDLLEPQTGIYYRVQLAAGHKQVNIKSYFRKYKLENRVFKENHDGWIKYSVGSFDVYKDAHDYRVHIWNTTPISDAFVAAYNGGKRITVQEALMVANQKWYK
jgi:hypothetical protein